MRTLVWLVLLSVASGCSPATTSNQSDAEHEGPTLDTFELDPANPIVIAGWWSNGRYLLEVEYDFAYRIRQGDYPDSPVIERGRWTRENHAAFNLEPYKVGKVEPERVALSLEKGVPVATIAGLTPFQKLHRPPQLLSDQLKSTWHGEPGTLILRNKSQFTLKRAGDSELIKGTWSLELGLLILRPTTSSEDAEVLSLRKSDRGQVEAILGLGAPLMRGPKADNPLPDRRIQS